MGAGILTMLSIGLSHVTLTPKRGTTDAEIKAPSVEKPELTNILPLKPGVCQNIATDASPTAENFCLVFIFQVRSLHFFQTLSLLLKCISFD